MRPSEVGSEIRFSVPSEDAIMMQAPRPHRINDSEVSNTTYNNDDYNIIVAENNKPRLFDDNSRGRKTEFVDIEFD